MSYLKSKLTAPQSIEDFTKDVTEYIQTKASQKDLIYLERELEGMIKDLEEWKAKNELDSK